jgi:hypothetical protein
MMTNAEANQSKIDELRRELADCEAQYGPRDRRTADAALKLAIYRRHEYPDGFDEAEALALRAADIFESLGEAWQGCLSGPFGILASIREQQGRLTEAEALLRRVVELNQEDGEDGSLYEDDLHSLGCLLLDQRRYVEAAEFLERALHVVEREYGMDYPYLGKKLQPLADAYVGLKRYDDAIALLRRNVDLEQRYRPDDLDERARLLETIADAHSKAERHDLADECFREAQQLRAQLDARLIAQMPDQQNLDAHHQEMDNLLEQADALARRKNFAGAIALVEKVLDHRGARSPAGPAAQTGLLRSLAKWRMELGQLAEAETLLHQARVYLESKAISLEELQQKMIEQRSTPNWRPGTRIRPIETFYSESLATIWNELGSLFQRQRKFAQAVDGFRQAVTIWKVTHEKAPAYVSTGLMNIALSLREQGDLARGGEVLAEALAWEQNLQADSTYVANLCANLAVFRQEQERLEESADLWLSAVKLWIKNEGACQPRVLEGLNRAGQALIELHQWDRARVCLQQALGVVREASWCNNQPIVALLLSLSSIELRQKRFAQALPYLREALPLCEAEPERLAEEYQAVLRRLTESLVMLDQFEEAETFGLRWLALLKRTVHAHDPELPAALANLAMTYQGHHRPAQALPLIEQAIPLVEQIAGATDPAAIANYYHIKADILRSLNRFAAAKAAEAHARQLKK